jgi:hypothetical protein
MKKIGLPITKLGDIELDGSIYDSDDAYCCNPVRAHSTFLAPSRKPKLRQVTLMCTFRTNVTILY